MLFDLETRLYEQMKNVIFLTGATGLVGANLMRRVLTSSDDTKLILLVRGCSNRHVVMRIEETLRLLSPKLDMNRTRKRITVLRGDITDPCLGLTPTQFRRTAELITHIVHAAATVRFDLPLECARSLNCAGTRNVLALGKLAQERGRIQRLAYISTAYVCGKREGTISESELDCGQSFANTYEQTKFESEQIIRNWMHVLPIAVFRPSIIVGDSRSGMTPNFNGLYGPLRLIHRGVLKVITGFSHTPLDVVPVDFVANAIYEIFLRRNEGEGRTFHLTGGKKNVITAGDLADFAVGFFRAESPQTTIPRVRFCPAEDWNPSINGGCVAQRFCRGLNIFAPYLSLARSFDSANTVEALKGTGISAPGMLSLLPTLLAYCVESDWGRRERQAA